MGQIARVTRVTILHHEMTYCQYDRCGAIATHLFRFGRGPIKAHYPFGGRGGTVFVSISLPFRLGRRQRRRPRCPTLSPAEFPQRHRRRILAFVRSQEWLSVQTLPMAWSTTSRATVMKSWSLGYLERYIEKFVQMGGAY